MVLSHDVAGDGPPLVLLHSTVADRRMWDPQWTALLDAGYRVVASTEPFQALEIFKQLKDEVDLVILDFTLPIMGRYQRKLLDKEVGVYRYDELVVLSRTSMPAVLLEAGSIINRDEELLMESADRQSLISAALD